MNWKILGVVLKIYAFCILVYTVVIDTLTRFEITFHLLTIPSDNYLKMGGRLLSMVLLFWVYILLRGIIERKWLSRDATILVFVFSLIIINMFLADTEKAWTLYGYFSKDSTSEMRQAIFWKSFKNCQFWTWDIPWPSAWKIPWN